jgi:hypothetical protein
MSDRLPGVTSKRLLCIESLKLGVCDRGFALWTFSHINLTSSVAIQRQRVTVKLEVFQWAGVLEDL